MTNALPLGAVLLLGLVASGHCIVMCGGISGALGLVTAKDRSGAPRRLLLVTYQLGRITSYTLAGLLVGSVGDRVISLLDIDSVRAGLRIATGAALVMAALAMLGYMKAPGLGLGRLLWPRIARLGRRLVPVTSTSRAFAFGMLWGWMPCGLVYSVLLIAALAANPMQSAAIMFAFGLGTLPAMLAAAWSAPRLAAWTARRSVRHGVGMCLLICAFAVMAGPWLVAHLPLLHAWLPFDCFASA
ncbi:MAG: sulfite exporter TauE/SafE family protein [Dokdonella sp.]